MNWNWEVIWEYFPRLLQGALTTLELVFISGVAGLLLAGLRPDFICAGRRLLIFSFSVALRCWCRYS